MTFYFMRERLESEDIEEIKDCLQSIRNNFHNTINYLKNIIY